MRRILPLCALLSSCANRTYPVSDHCDGKRFHSIPPVNPSFSDVLKWQIHRHPAPWPDSLPVTPTVPPAGVDSGLLATWVGHATVLVQAPGLNFLTDPVWSPRVGPWSWVGSKRKAAPGVRFEDLPRIDAVLLSHDHYDHTDLPTLRRLAVGKDPVGIVPLGLGGLVREAGFRRVVELDWWQSTVLPTGDTVTLVPSRHWGARWLWDRFDRLWGGFVVATRGGRVYFAGDTGDGPQFAEIFRRLGPVDLALLPIGAFQPRWFMAPQHIGPDQALAAAKTLGARTSLAIHWGTFALADDGPREAADTLEALRALDPAAPDFRAVPIGTAVALPPRPGRAD
jgi:L-ascorbate metabolism protein UlaG (beta-lactamase superfamily)